MPASDVIVVGGGVVGLSIAYVLSREGATVRVLDSGPIGRGASWAGAGIIPANTRHLKSNPTVAFRSLSAVLYEQWSMALREETGLDNGYRRCGGLDVAWTVEEERELQSMAGRWRVEQIDCEKLGPKEFLALEPGLNPEIRLAYYLPDRAQIRNPWHLKALETSLRSRGVDVRPDCPATGFVRDGDRVVGVETPAGPMACGQVVVSAGPWSGKLLEGLGLDLPTPPWKGEIVLLRSDRPLLRRIVEHGKNYLVPRDDGRVLIGATEECVGFDLRPTPVAVRDLLAFGLNLCPALADAQVETTWAGLRPGSLDTRPYIGYAPGISNLVVATGHKRAGLQLAPATAEVVGDLLLGREPRVPIGQFRLDREPASVGDDVFRS